jgi:phenylacetate-CoA ligase
LLRHAKKNVPFYEHRLDAVVKPNGDIDWDRWGEIPIVRRQDIAVHGEEMISRELIGGHASTTTATTSGTTGAPVTVVSTQVAHIALHANRFRSYRWHGIDWRGVCVSVLGEEPEYDWPHGKALGTWGPSWDPDSVDGELIRIGRRSSVPQLLEFFRRKHAAYLTTGPSTAFALALEMRALGEQWRFDAFLPHGSSVESDARAVIHDVLGAKSVDLYSSKEAGHIAGACPNSDGLHVNAESVLVEIINDDGEPVTAGDPGRVIVTPFFNAAQPLIRYDQGDVATAMPICSCGRHLPRLERLIGRTVVLFFHPDGRIRTSFLGHHRHLLGCEEWQIAQTGPTHFEVRYVPIDPAVPGDEQALLVRMRESYFEDIDVKFLRVDALSKGPGGKLVEYVNEWRPTHAG